MAAVGFQSVTYLKSGKSLRTDIEYVTYEKAQEAATQLREDLKDKKAVFSLTVGGSVLLIPRESIDYLEVALHELEDKD